MVDCDYKHFQVQSYDLPLIFPQEDNGNKVKAINSETTIEENNITINSKRVKAHTKLSANDLIRIPPNLINQDKNIDINTRKYA